MTFKVSIRVALAVLGFSGVMVQATAITGTNFFGAGDIIVNFDTLPGVVGAPISGTALTNQYALLGVRFSSENVTGAFQSTDAGDTNGRFGASMLILAAQSGGGAPKSTPRYASGVTYLGNPVADMRIDFTSPVAAFGMWIIDNDQSVGRLQAFSSDGTLLSTLVVPQVGANGSVFHGIDISGSGSAISYVIYDGNNGNAIDSTFLDDLYFRPVAVPEPGTASLLLAGAAVLGGIARRRARK